MDESEVILEVPGISYTELEIACLSMCRLLKATNKGTMVAVSWGILQNYVSRKYSEIVWKIPTSTTF